MALTKSNQLHIQPGVATATFTPRDGFSARVKRIDLFHCAVDGFCEIRTRRTSVGFFKVAPQARLNANPVVLPVTGNHLAPKAEHRDLWVGATERDPVPQSLFPMLEAAGIPIVYPVAQGETISVEAPGLCDAIVLVYDEYDAPDVSPEEMNGSASQQLRWLHYLRNSADRTAQGFAALDEVVNPIEYPRFPVEDVPSLARLTIHGLLARATGSGTGNGAINVGTAATTRLRLIRDRAALFDEDRGGFIYQGQPDVAIVAAATVHNSIIRGNMLPFNPTPRAPLHMFSPPLEFLGGEELDIETDQLVTGTGQLNAQEILVALLMTIDFGGGR